LPLEVLSAAAGDFIAIIDAGSEADPNWLGHTVEDFAHPQTAVVVGQAAPSGDLDALAVAITMDNRPLERAVFDGSTTTTPMEDAMSLARSPLVARKRLVAEALGSLPGGVKSVPTSYVLYLVLASGRRIVFDPARFVFDEGEPNGRQARLYLDEAQDHIALAALCLLRHGEHAAPRALVRACRRAGDARGVATAFGGRGQAFGLGGVRALAAGTWRAAVLAVALKGGPKFEDRTAASRWDQRAPPLTVREDAPRVSVIIPTRNRRDLLTQVLDALNRQTVPADRYEVIVVVDGSTDGSEDYLEAVESRARLHVIRQAHSGLPAARNLGAANASEPVLVFLDDDLLPVPSFIAAHANAHAEGNPRQVIIGCCVSAARGRGAWGKMLRASWDDHFESKAEDHHPWGFLDYSAGNSSISRELFDACGGFDEQFRRRNEEHDLGYRLLVSGVRFRYARDAMARHLIDGRFVTSLRAQTLQGFYDMVLVAKHTALQDRIVLADLVSKHDGELSPLGRLVRAYPTFAERLLPLGAAVAGCLDIGHFRQAHQILAGSLMSTAYLIGVGLQAKASGARRAYPNADAARPRPSVAKLDLSTPGLLPIPAPDSIASVSVSWRRVGLADVPAAEPGREWNWVRLRERTLDMALPALRNAVPLAELLEAAALDCGEAEQA
jgi:glycosyltransferase involved in cell wall biosynthesis